MLDGYRTDADSGSAEKGDADGRAANGLARGIEKVDCELSGRAKLPTECSGRERTGARSVMVNFGRAFASKSKP